MVWALFETIDDHADFRVDMRVSQWPRPDTNRVKCDFRMALGEGTPFPRPGRFKLWMDFVPEAPLGRLYPVIDMDVSGDFELHGTSGVNESGREVELDIVEHLEADFPGSDFPGIEYAFTFKHAGHDDYHSTWYWEHESTVHPPTDILMRVSSEESINNLILVEDVPSELDVDWPINDFTPQFSWDAMSECFDFRPPLVEGPGAEFNGVDSYISLSDLMPAFNSPFVISARIRLHDTTGFWPLMGRSFTGGFLGMDDDDLIHGFLRLETSWTPVLDEWFNWRYEFEQETQLGYKLFIDDIEVMSGTFARQNSSYNMLGVYRHGISGTIWGNFDLLNLLVLNGSAPSTDVELDMPLSENALDSGPKENHGTTFNMDLPST
jgi:hypothetical protein